MARSPTDDQWYRAVCMKKIDQDVEDVFNSQIVVFFLDIGCNVS